MERKTIGRAVWFASMTIAVAAVFIALFHKPEEHIEKRVKVQSVKAEPFDALNSVLGHDEREVIIGVFNGKKMDTLRIAPAATTEYADSMLYVTLDGKRFKDDENAKEWYWRYLWDINSSNGSVPTLRVGGVKPKMVFEGDLDGNGTDEFGVLFTWLTSAHRSYDVYTFHDGHWCCLIPSVETAESLRASGLELVQPGDKPGEVKVTMSDFDAPGSCYTCAPSRDTVLHPTFEPIWNWWEER